MLIEQTLEKLHAMKLSGMADALRQQLGSAEHAKLAFDERFGLLADAEWLGRGQRKLTRRLQEAELRYPPPPASMEDIASNPPRGLDRQQVLSLGTGGFVHNRHNLVITGPTGSGKSYISCAFVERACRPDSKAASRRLPRPR